MKTEGMAVATRNRDRVGIDDKSRARWNLRQQLRGRGRSLTSAHDAAIWKTWWRITRYYNLQLSLALLSRGGLTDRA